TACIAWPAVRSYLVLPIGQSLTLTDHPSGRSSGIFVNFFESSGLSNRRLCRRPARSRRKPSSPACPCAEDFILNFIFSLPNHQGDSSSENDQTQVSSRRVPLGALDQGCEMNAIALTRRNLYP